MRRRAMDAKLPPWSQQSGKPPRGVAARSSAEQRGVTADDLEALADILSATSLEDALSCSTTLGFSSSGSLYRRQDGWSGQEHRWTGMPLSSRVASGASSSAVRGRRSEHGLVCSCLQPTCQAAGLSSTKDIKASGFASKRGKSGSQVGGQRQQVSHQHSPVMRTHPPAAAGRGQRVRDVIEEFVLDDNELSLLTCYSTPVDTSRRQRIRKSANLKTVSIIDTLSELLESDDLDKKWSLPTGSSGSGVQDIAASLPDITHLATEEQEPARVRSNVSQRRKFDVPDADIPDLSPSLTSYRGGRHRIVETCIQKPKLSRGGGTSTTLLPPHTGGKRHTGLLPHGTPSYTCPLSCRGVPSSTPCGQNFVATDVPNYMTTPARSFLSIAKQHRMNIPGYSCFNTSCTVRDHLSTKHLRGSKSHAFDVGGGTMTFHEHVATDHRPNVHARKEEMDWSRQCFSDSEVRRPREVTPSSRAGRNSRGTAKRSTATCSRKPPPDTWKCVGGSLAGITKPLESCPEKTPTKTRQGSKSHSSSGSKQRARVPEWIKSIFAIAKKGDVHLLKESLKDMDAALIRNLSDQNGNNLWHIAATNNHLECIQWLCEKERQEVLRDENKHGLNPVVCAVKHGSLEALQWLIRYTNCKRLVALPEGSRSLLHFAAKYGQERLLHWLAEYMQENDLSLSLRDAEGNTALHLAARYGRITCVKALVLHSADITARNELGLKAYDLAYHSGQVACADYLLAMEACLSLSADHLLLEADVQHLRTENTELKSQFKELLVLARRLVKGQEELLDTFGRLLREERRHSRESAEETEDGSSSKEFDDAGKCCAVGSRKHLSPSQLRTLQDEYAKWRTVVLPEGEGRLHMAEEKWRRLRLRPYRKPEPTLTPLDVIRTQFAQVLAKATDPRLVTDLRLLSSSESSLSEESNGDDDDDDAGDDVRCSDTALSEEGPLEDLMSHESVPESQRASSSAVWNVPRRLREPVPDFVPQEGRRMVARKVADAKSKEGKAAASPSDVNLRVFFQRNPELRQEGQTCSVVEVLEPSSSDNEEWCHAEQKPKAAAGGCKEKEVTESGNNSSSSSVRSCRDFRPFAASGKSNQRSQTSSSGNEARSRKGEEGETFHPNNKSLEQARSAELEDAVIGDVSPVTGSRSEDSSYESGDTVIPLADLKSEPAPSAGDNYVEPDLLKGTKATTVGRQSCAKHHASPRSSPEIQAASEDPSELRCLQTSCETLGSASDTSVEGASPSTAGHVGAPKKKSFLSKFTLRGRWPSKQKSSARPAKKPEEISPEEFREIYSRSTCLHPPASQEPRGCERLSPKGGHLSKSTPAIPSAAEGTADADATKDAFAPFPPDSVPSLPHMPPPVSLVRRGPPPAPPIGDVALRSFSLYLKSDAADDGQQDSSSSTPCDEAASSHELNPVSVRLSTSISSGSTFGSSTLEGQACSFALRPSSSASKSDSLSRPASSASRVESPPRSEDNYKSDGGFQLCKASSTSTELLVTPDSSTAGRQSPAPSEVSKTESALSPPSDVSKTESTRHLHHLGKIEEIANGSSNAPISLVKTAAIVDVAVASANKVCAPDPGVAEDVIADECRHEAVPQDVVKVKALNSKKSSEKPWYEVSDDEDTFSPGHYKLGRVRSSSEDEADEAMAVACSPNPLRESVFSTSGNVV